MDKRTLEVMEYVLGQMTLAGWVHEFGHTDAGMGLRWTDKGHAAAKQFRDLFDALGRQMSGEELAMLNVVVDTMSRYPREDDTQ